MPSAPQEQPQVNPWIVAVAVMFATFMEVLDTTVVNVSLPHIAGSLSASVDEAAWALTSYLVANAIILPMTGWLANYFGRKRTLLAAVVGFTSASFLCGLAPTLPTLIVFRVIQGATGGCLQPLSQAVMLEAFPPKDRGKAMAFWGLGIVVAPMLGPVLGGWLTDNYSWRWVFYINLPVGLASIIMTRLFIFDPPYIRAVQPRYRFLGHRDAGRGHRRTADRARQRPGGRLVRIQLDRHPGGAGGPGHRGIHRGASCARAIRWCTCASSRTAPTAPASS